MKKYYNPVKLLLSMPIDTLEAFVAEMVRRESESRVQRIMRRIKRTRVLTKDRVSKHRKNILKKKSKCNAKKGRRTVRRTSKG